MTPILYSSDEIDFLNNGLGQLVDLYDVDIHEQRNGLLNLTAYYPVNGQRYADISEGNIILAKPSPLDDNHAFRIVSVALDITGYAVMIEADSITYDLTNNISKTIHMLGDGQAAMTAIQKSTLHPHIFTFYSDITHTSESQLRYVNPMEAIAGTQGSFLQIWGGELKRENRRVAMFKRRGRDNIATFRLGKNISGLKYTVDVSNLTTEIVPTVTVNSTDASRTIEGATVQSSRMGNYPLVYSKMVDVSQDVKVDEGDTDDQIKAKINAFAANWFVQSDNTGKDLPEVTVEVEVESLQDSADYADKFAKLETIGLTDTVTVYVPEYGVNVTAIVNELHYDPIGERVTSLVVGTAKVSFADSNKSALSDLENKVTQVQEQATQAVTSANGKNKIYHGRTKPEHPQEGDTWFWEDGENSGIKVFKNGDWVDVVDSKTQERITNEVKNAVDTAAAYADKLNSTQAEATNSLADELAEKADELTKSQQNIASQATAYTDSAVAQATANAQQIGQTTAQNAQKALDNAKIDLTKSIASEASARSQAVSSANSLAQSYANQAKSDAISAAATADGVIRKDFKDTTDGLVSTITQNKKTADAGISTAQTTAQQAVDGLKTKVSQTDYNTKTGQLQTDLTATTQTANQAKTDIVSIKQKDGEQDEKMNSIVSDVNGTKQTVSDLKIEQGKQSGSISKLEQRANGFDATVSKVDELVNDLGQINQLNNTEFTPDFSGWYLGGSAEGSGSVFKEGNPLASSDAWSLANGKYKASNVLRHAHSVMNSISSDLIPVGANVDITASVMSYSTPDYNGTVSAAIYLRFYDSNKAYISSTKIDSPRLSTWTRVKLSVVSPANTNYVSFNLLTNGNIGISYYSQPMLVFSKNIGSYIRGNYNNNYATSKAQLTADNATLALNNYKTDADGRISKAQTDIQANATAISQKVSQTVYDQKTGELTSKVSTAQQTADSAKQTIGNYITANDKRVQSAETNIQANSDAIKATVSKTEFNEATGKITGDVSELKQSSKEISGTVSKLQETVNDLGQVNQLFNTEFTPDFSGWYLGSSTSGKRGDVFQPGTPLASSDAWSLANGKYKASNVLRHAHSVMNSISSDLIPVGANVDITASVMSYSTPDYNGTVSAAIYLRFYDSNKSYITAMTIDSAKLSTWTQVKFSTVSPANTNYVSFNLLTNGNAGVSYYAQPMMVFDNKIGSYSVGNYNNNSQLAQVKITTDGVYQAVNDPKTGLNVRVSTAEGNFEQIKSNVSGLSNTVTKTVDGLTQEIKDRANGDSNTLQSGKDFTTSQIKSYDNGLQTQLTQTSNAFIARISSLNLVNNSGFEYANDNQLQGWHKGTPWGPMLSFNSGFYIHEQNPDGTISIRHDYANDSSWIYSDPIPTTANANFAGSIEIAEGTGWNTSSQIPFAIDIKYYDANKNAINNLRINYNGTTIGGTWPRKSFTLTTPANTKYIAFGMGWNGGSIAFKRPALYAGSTDYGYMPGSKIGTQTALQLLKDNFQLGVKDNIGNIISGINGDTSGLMLTGKHIFLDGEVTAVGKSWLDGAVIKDATIGRAQIADLSVDSSKIINLDVNKITGNVANFIRAYWDGRYGSTSIDSDGMTVSAGLATTTFDKDGMKFEKSNRSVGRIGVNDLYQDFSKKGLYFGLESTGDFMAWGAQNYAGNPYTTKLSWFRTGAVPSNLPGLIEGFNFEDNVSFRNPIEIRGGIKMQGTNDNLLVRASNLNGGSYPTFGATSAYFVYAGSDIYLSSNGTAINLTKIIKAFGGIRTAAIPTGFNSNGTASGWYNVNMG